LILLLFVMFLENWLIFPAPRFPDGQWQPTDIRVEDVYFTSADGTRLHGWYVDHPRPVAYVLYCHGNGEHLGYLDWLFAHFHQLGWAVFAFDYRGYGRSEGSADEEGVLADGHAALAWLQQRTNRSASQVVLMGRSIGGAVAIDLAVTHGAQALVVESSFTSLPDVAAKLFWWAPARWLLRTQFDSESKIRRYQGPLLQSHGTADRLVPLSLARRLFAACPSADKQFFEVRGGDHNDLPPPEYYELAQEFLRGHSARDAHSRSAQ
jgi:fermentation-respiration switch protein FrsA (DUF1100 family)